MGSVGTPGVESQLADIELLQELSAELIHAEDVEALYRKIIAAAVQIMRSDFASMQMFYPERGRAGELRLLAFHGFDPESARFWEWVRADSGCTCGEVLRTGKRAIAAEVATCAFMAGTPDREALLKAGMQAAQSTPLLSRAGRLVGMISTHWKRPHHPTDRDLRLLDIVARQAADLIERRKGEEDAARSRAALMESERQKDTLYRLTDRLHRADRVEEIYEAGIDAVLDGLQCQRASILLSDAEGVMRFRAWRGLSEPYRRAVEGHSPWPAGEAAPQPICIADIASADIAPALKEVVLGEGIHALAFIPLIGGGRLIGKFMAYFDRPHEFPAGEIELSLAIAHHIALGIERSRTGDALLESARKFRDMIDALPAAIYTTDAGGRITHFNPAAVEFSGRTPVLGSDSWCVSWKLYHADGSPMPHETCPMALAVRDGSVLRGAEAIAELPDGRRRWFTPFPTPIRDAGGRIIGGINMLVDITERRAADEARKEGDRRKDEFLAMLAHELRNPLAPIRNAVELLQQDSGPVMVGKVKDILGRQVNHMISLVDDLIDVARITNGNIALDQELVDLAQVIHNAVETSQPAIQAAGHRLALDVPPSPVKVFGDPVRLTQVVSNLINNSARYTPPGGEIRVSLRPDGEQAAISVRDNGQGIAADMLQRVFELFVQANAATNRPARAGLGVGLPLARRLVEMHGGTIEGRSEGIGMGSEFVVRLPFAPVSAAVESSGEARVDPAIQRRRVLVVDDNVDAADSLTMLLRQMGHEVHTAYDAPGALAAAEHAPPEVVLLDLSMPQIDGYTLALRLRKGARRVSGMRIIALTGHGFAEHRRRSEEAGFDEHLVKPVQPDLLNAVMRP